MSEMTELLPNTSYNPQKSGKIYLSTEECLFLCGVFSSGRKFRKLNNLFLSASSESPELKEKIKESLLQVYLFAGFPTALHSLKLFYHTVGDTGEDFEKYEQEKFLSRGYQNFGLVYGKNVEKLLKNISSYSEQLADWVIREGYGKVYGRGKLSFREREVVALGALASLGLEDQMMSHLKGLHRSGEPVSGIKRFLELFCEVSGKGHCIKVKKIFERFIQLTGK